MKKIIHVNMHNIKWNTKHDAKKPVFTIKEGRKNIYSNKVEILGPSSLIYSPDKALNCGARCWIETTSEIIVYDPISVQDMKCIK